MGREGGGDVRSFGSLGAAPLRTGFWCKFHGGEGQTRSQAGTPESKIVRRMVPRKDMGMLARANNSSSSSLQNGRLKTTKDIQHKTGEGLV